MDSPNILISRVPPTAHSDLLRLDHLVTQLTKVEVLAVPSNPGLTPDIAPPAREDKTKSLEKWMGFG